MSGAHDAARELLAMTGWEVSFPGKHMLSVLLEVLLEESDLTVTYDGRAITIKKQVYRLEVEPTQSQEANP